MTVKVCGLTCLSDAIYAKDQGADLLGFVAHPPSPRHCADLSVASIVQESAVLVTVGDDADTMMRLADSVGFRRIQPHVSPKHRKQVIQRLKAEGYFIILPWSDEPLQETLNVDLYLWEASPRQTGVAGGSGQTHAMAFPPPGFFILAGGLDASNLAERKALMPPSASKNHLGYDAASRLEKAPGIKDPDKVRDYILAAKQLMNEASHDRH